MAESVASTISILDDSTTENTDPVRRGAQQDIVYLSSNEEDDQTEQGDQEDEEEVMETEEDDDEAEYLKSRSKQPRLDPGVTAASEGAKKASEPEPVEEEHCSICLEPWTNSGGHRLVSLKCGHLYGETCIERWIKTAGKCPQCNRPSKRADLRRIYAKSLKVLDTFELDRALKSLEEEKSLRKRAEISASELRIQYQMATEECMRYKNEFYRLKKMLEGPRSVLLNITNEPASSMASAGSTGSLSFQLDKMINITETSGCRIVTYSPRSTAILVSQPSNNAIFPGFGIKKINLLDYKLSQYIPVHSKLIRDIAVNTLHDDGIILTCGIDKTIKLINLANNALVHSYETAQPIWSCTYNLDNPVYFYAGLQNGHVVLFDKRKIDRYVSVLNSEINNGSPCCSLQYIPRSQNSPFNRSGLVVSQLDKLCFFETNVNDEYKYHPLLVEANIMSCSFELSTRHLLLSTRPSQKFPKVRHLVYEIAKNKAQAGDNDSDYSMNLIQTFTGSDQQKMLARSKLYSIGSNLYALASDEPSRALNLWGVSKNELASKLVNSSEVLDSCFIQSDAANQIVCSLTDKQLRIFRKN